MRFALNLSRRYNKHSHYASWMKYFQVRNLFHCNRWRDYFQRSTYFPHPPSPPRLVFFVRNLIYRFPDREQCTYRSQFLDKINVASMMRVSSERILLWSIVIDSVIHVISVPLMLFISWNLIRRFPHTRQCMIGQILHCIDDTAFIWTDMIMICRSRWRDKYHRRSIGMFAHICELTCGFPRRRQCTTGKEFGLFQQRFIRRNYDALESHYISFVVIRSNFIDEYRCIDEKENVDHLAEIIRAGVKYL